MVVNHVRPKTVKVSSVTALAHCLEHCPGTGRRKQEGIVELLELGRQS